MEPTPPAPRARLSLFLHLGILVALTMGVGPGLLLVLPDAGERSAFALGMPVALTWAMFWFAVELVLLVTAYRTVWREDAARD